MPFCIHEKRNYTGRFWSLFSEKNANGVMKTNVEINEICTKTKNINFCKKC